MIYIFDNGYDYSDHAIEFISTDGYPQAEAEALLTKYYRFDPNDNEWPFDDEDDYSSHFLVAKAQSVEWFEGAPRMLCSVVTYRPFRRNRLEGLTDEMMRCLIAGWFKELDERRESYRKHYENFPQPKRGKLLLDQHLEQVDADEEMIRRDFAQYV